MAKKAVKKKKTKGIFENRLSIVFITMVVVSMAIVLGVKVRSIKKELANREAYNQKNSQRTGKRKRKSQGT